MSEYDKFYSDEEVEEIPKASEEKKEGDEVPPPQGDEEVKEKPKPKKKKGPHEEKWFLHHKYKYPAISHEK